MRSNLIFFIVSIALVASSYASDPAVPRASKVDADEGQVSLARKLVKVMQFDSDVLTKITQPLANPVLGAQTLGANMSHIERVDPNAPVFEHVDPNAPVLHNLTATEGDNRELTEIFARSRVEFEAYFQNEIADELNEDIAVKFASLYTTEELQAMLVFYGTPVGKTIARKQYDAMAEVGAIELSLAEQLNSKLKEIIKRNSVEEGYRKGTNDPRKPEMSLDSDIKFN